MSELNLIQRGQIQVLKEEGYTERQIAIRINVSKTAVHKTLAKLRSTGSHNSLKRSGRPRVTTPQTDRMIRRESVSNLYASASYIQS